MADKLRLREMVDSDIILFKKWLYENHVSRWYSDPLAWIHEIENRHDEFFWIHHFIVMLDHKDIGFCQFYEYKHGRESWHGDVEMEGTYSIDYLIGEKNCLSIGLGKEIIQLLTKTIFNLPDGKRIIVQPDPDNEASCNALLSAGYKYDHQNKLYYIERK